MTLSAVKGLRSLATGNAPSKPRALLLDEPFNKLDFELKARFRNWFSIRPHLAASRSLMVSHDPGDAEAAGSPVIEVKK